MGPRSFDRGKSALFNYSTFKDLAVHLRAASAHRASSTSFVDCCPAQVAENTSHFLMRAPPAFYASPGLSRNSSSHEYRILLQLAFDRLSQETRLDLKQAAVTNTIVEERMRHQRIHPRFVGTKEIFATRYS